MSVMEESIVTDVVFAEDASAEALALAADDSAYLMNEQEVWNHNLEAMRVGPDAFDAFMELVRGADAEYLDAQEYVAPAEPSNTVDWDSVNAALNESQQILIGVQKLLSETLEHMGVEDHAYIRVYSDAAGAMRLVGEHPRREEIEATLNSPVNSALRSLYQAATTGMSMAGSLVGKMSVPEEVLEQIKDKYSAAC